MFFTRFFLLFTLFLCSSNTLLSTCFAEKNYTDSIQNAYEKNFPEFKITTIRENFFGNQRYTTRLFHNNLERATVEIFINNKPYIHLDYIEVHPNFQNQGLGSRLLDTLKQIALQDNFKGITLSAEYLGSSDTPLHKKYKAYRKLLRFYKKHNAYYYAQNKINNLHQLMLSLMIPTEQQKVSHVLEKPKKVIKQHKTLLTFPKKSKNLSGDQYYLAYTVQHLFCTK